MDEKNKISVLVVDDDPEILEAVSTILKSQGHNPETADPDHPENLERLRAGTYRPDLVLLDILLSGKDGRDICRELKASPKTKNIPIVMFSAYPHAEDSAKKAGADGFLAKPFGLRDLNNTFNKVLGKKIG